MLLNFLSEISPFAEHLIVASGLGLTAVYAANRWTWASSKPAANSRNTREPNPSKTFFRTGAAIQDWTDRPGDQLDLAAGNPAAPDSGSDRRDVGLGEAIMFAVLGEWGRTPTDKGFVLLSAGDKLALFRHRAREGMIEVWGTIMPHDKRYMPIHPDYWITHHVHLLEVMRGEAKSRRWATRSQDHIYYNLMVSKAQFEKHLGAR